MQMKRSVGILVAAVSVGFGMPHRGIGAGVAPDSKEKPAVKKDGQAKPVRERTEWCQLRWANAPDTKRPRVLLIGDSIVVGYSGEVDRLLRGKANVDMLATSASIDHEALVKMTRLAMDGYAHTIIHFNNGLHGWHVTDEDYAKHLKRYVQTLKRLAPKATLIWASSTPVSVGGKPTKLSPKNAIPVRRNAIAASIMAAHHIPTTDLYALVVGKAPLRSNDGYHYNTKGRTVQAKAVAAVLVEALKSRDAK